MHAPTTAAIVCEPGVKVIRNIGNVHYFFGTQVVMVVTTSTFSTSFTFGLL